MTLYSLVITSMPTYSMQTALFSPPICAKINFLYKHFLWGMIDGRRTHLLNWAQVCKPKYTGGLGLHSARASNLACMSKIGWGLINSNDLWAQVL